MKVLKNILVGFLVLIVLLVGGVVVFLKTFDMNKYVPQITQQVVQTIGRDLKIGHAALALSWRQGDCG